MTRAWPHNIGPASQGQQTRERFPRDAALCLHVGFSTVTGGSGEAEGEAFASLTDAREACISLAGRAARAATDRYESSIRLQALMNEVCVAEHSDVATMYAFAQPWPGSVKRM